MKVHDILHESSYPNNIGAMEIFDFYKSSTPEQKEILDRHIDNKDYDGAWKLIQDVTGVELHPMGESYEIFSDPITSLVVSRNDKEIKFPVVKAKSINPKWWEFIIRVSNTLLKVQVDLTNNKVYTHKGKSDREVQFVGDILDIQREKS